MYWDVASGSESVMVCLLYTQQSHIAFVACSVVCFAYLNTFLRFKGDKCLELAPPTVSEGQFRFLSLVIKLLNIFFGYSGPQMER